MAQQHYMLIVELIEILKGWESRERSFHKSFTIWIGRHLDHNQNKIILWHVVIIQNCFGIGLDVHGGHAS